VALGAAIALALVPLLLAQRYVTRISHRVFNIAMLAATVAVAGVSVWAIIGLTSEQNSLATAQRDGSDLVEARSAATVLLSRAQGDLSLTLVNRGTDESDPLDFTAVTRALTNSSLAPGLSGGFASYAAAARHVQGLERGGQLEQAILQAPVVGKISQGLSTDLTDQVAAAQNSFTHAASDAASALSGLWLAIPLAAILAAALGFLGLRQRINEYR
jgi:hypothetical protein